MAAALALGLLMGPFACEETPPPRDEPTDETPEIAEIKPTATDENEDGPEEVVEPEPVEFVTWPGLEKQKTFELMWLGGDEEVELHDEPRADADVVGDVGWLDGQEFEWINTVVYVEEPRSYRVAESTELSVTPYDIEYGELEADERVYELEDGDEIFLYQYGGEKTCYLGIEDDVVLGDCPYDGIDVAGDELETEERWTPIAEQWWVEVEVDGVEGWLFVDEAPVSVHPREVEGYDDARGMHEFEP